MRNPSFWRVALVLAAGMAVAAQAGGDLPTVTVAKKTMPNAITLDGVVEASRQATVAAQTAGEIVDLNFDVNDFVEKGQVLLRFRDQKTAAGVSQTRAGVDEAEARVQQAKGEFDRTKQLFDKQMATAARMDQVKAELLTAESRLQSAKAAVSGASEQLSDTVVHAPYSGYVLKRFVELGGTALVGQPLFSGLSLDELRVRVNLPQGLASQLRQRHGQVALTLPDGTPHQTGDYTLFPYADDQAHTFAARIPLPAKVKGLYPGMLIKVAFNLGEQERLLLPEQAVVRRGEVTGVYVLGAGNRAQLRHVLSGRKFDDHQVEILSGLAVGDQVVLDPVRAGQQAKAAPPSGSHP